MIVYALSYCFYLRSDYDFDALCASYASNFTWGESWSKESVITDCTHYRKSDFFYFSFYGFIKMNFRRIYWSHAPWDHRGRDYWNVWAVFADSKFAKYPFTQAQTQSCMISAKKGWPNLKYYTLSFFRTNFYELYSYLSFDCWLDSSSRFYNRNRSIGDVSFRFWSSFVCSGFVWKGDYLSFRKLCIRGGMV